MHLLPRRGLHTSQGIKLQRVNSLSPACSVGPALRVGETLEIACCNRAQLEQCLLVLVFLLWCNSEGCWGVGVEGSDALPVTCASALLSGMIQLQLFCGSNNLILFSSSPELSPG